MTRNTYIAGPMSYIPQFNFPAFMDAAATLRAKGMNILSPAEIDNAEDHGAAMASPDGVPNPVNMNGKTWGDFLSRDVKLIADECDSIVLLPGWEKSRGARLEVCTGLLCNHAFFKYQDGQVEPLSRAEVVGALTKRWGA